MLTNYWITFLCMLMILGTKSNELQHNLEYPTKTIEIRSSSAYFSGYKLRSSKIERAAPTAYGNCSATNAQPPWKFVALSYIEDALKPLKIEFFHQEFQIIYCCRVINCVLQNVKWVYLILYRMGFLYLLLKKVFWYIS